MGESCWWAAADDEGEDRSSGEERRGRRLGDRENCFNGSKSGKKCYLKKMCVSICHFELKLYIDFLLCYNGYINWPPAQPNFCTL